MISFGFYCDQDQLPALLQAVLSTALGFLCEGVSSRSYVTFDDLNGDVAVYQAKIVIVIGVLMS